MAAENTLNEKMKKKVGDTIVDGTIDSIKTKIAENIDDIIPVVVRVAAVVLCINGAFNFVNQPRPTTNNGHFYIHIV